MHARGVVGGSVACLRVRVSGALASRVEGVVVALGDAADVALVGHDVQELQGAFLAVDVGHVYAHAVGHVRGLNLAVWTRGVIVRNMIQKDDSCRFRLIENGDTERRSCNTIILYGEFNSFATTYYAIYLPE